MWIYIGIGNVFDPDSLKYIFCDKAKQNWIVRVKLPDIYTKVFGMECVIGWYLCSTTCIYSHPSYHIRNVEQAPFR